LTITCKKKY